VKTRNLESNSRWKLPLSIDPAINPHAQELVDLYFFETVVRIHPAGESEPYTGLKPVGRDLGPTVPAADKANDSKGTCYKKLRRKRRSRAGREHVKAYVEFVHYAEEVYASVHEHSRQSASPVQPH
jgi:hypothetical protein